LELITTLVNTFFFLNTDILPSITDDVYFSSLRVRIILPEGASYIEWVTPFPVDATQDLEVTYLDIWGRPAVNFRTEKLVRDHNQKFQVNYNFSSTSMFVEPFIVIIGIFSILGIVIVLSRVELSIYDSATKENDHAIYQLEKLFDERDDAFQIFEDAINDYVESADKETYEKAMKSADESVDEVHQRIEEASQALSKKSKVDELWGQTTVVINNIKENHKLTIDYKITKKIQNSVFATQSKKLQSKIDSAKERSETLMTSILENNS